MKNGTMKTLATMLISLMLALCAANLFADGPYDEDYNPRVGATPIPGSEQSIKQPSYTASYTVTIIDGVVYVSDADGETFARVKCSVWAKGVNQPLPTTRDERRHFALDIVAAAVAGNGGREQTTAPDLPVITVKEGGGSRRNAITLTIEHGTGFAILADMDQRDFYYAQIMVIPPDELKRQRWFNPAPAGRGEVLPG